MKFINSRKAKSLIVIILVLACTLILYQYFGADNTDLPFSIVQSGLFTVDLNETGRLRAENSVTISAPPIRMNLQIVELVPEGTLVKEGELVVQFDTTDINQTIDDRRSEINLERANMRRSMVSMKNQLASLASSVENSQASFRLSELRVEQMEFESDVQKEEGSLNLFQAKLALTQAKDKLDAQRQIDSVEVLSLELNIRQAEADLKKSIRDKNRLTIHAPAPGLVVYKESWRGGSMSKVKIGDTPWRGQILLELPDLSVMMIETFVSEIDMAKVALDQVVKIKLDAYAEPVFNGTVVDIANIARQQDGLSEANVFDILIRIEGADKLLKPGMSATVDIIIDEIPESVWVPIESVFYLDDKPVVYRKKGRKWKAEVVELGARNNNSVIIGDNIKPGEKVSLVDLSLDEDVVSPQLKGSKGDKKGNRKNHSSKRSGKRHRRG